MAIVTPTATPQVVVVCPTTQQYDALHAWLTAATPSVRATAGVASFSGQRSQRTMTIVGAAQLPRIDTSIPLGASAAA